MQPILDAFAPIQFNLQTHVYLYWLHDIQYLVWESNSLLLPLKEGASPLSLPDFSQYGVWTHDLRLIRPMLYQLS